MQNWTLRWVPCPLPQTPGSKCILSPWSGNSGWSSKQDLGRRPHPNLGSHISRSQPTGGWGQGKAAPSRLRTLPLLPLQKIMHTRKRHQDMFQDLNRKLQHAEKDKEVLGPESKVWGQQGLGAVGQDCGCGAGLPRETP